MSLLLLSSILLISDLYAYRFFHSSVRWICIQNGIASWYGIEEQGKLTADGEIFDRHKFTAASRQLPFNSKVRVINRENGRSIEVRINDRGPYAGGRVLDLSEAAAKALDMKKPGVVPVDIEIMQAGKENSEQSTPP